jgi:SSS family solute:Na+ symporter
MTSFSFFMWPQNFAAAYTAKSGKILRRNAVLMPLYSITMPLVIFAGLTALLVVPKLANGDLALLTVVEKTFPAWFLGVIGGAGALTAMVPAAIQLQTAATLFAKNLCRPVLAPNMTDREVAMLAKFMVLVLTSGALLLAVHSSISLVALLLLGYSGVAQFFPGVILGLFSRRARGPAVFAGMVSGVVVLAFLGLTNRDPWMGWNAGFLALSVNAGVTGLVSWFHSTGLEQERAFSAETS